MRTKGKNVILSYGLLPIFLNQSKILFSVLFSARRMLPRRQMALKSIHKHNWSSVVKLAWLSTRSDSSTVSHSVLDCAWNTNAAHNRKHGNQRTSPASNLSWKHRPYNSVEIFWSELDVSYCVSADLQVNSFPLFCRFNLLGDALLPRSTDTDSDQNYLRKEFFELKRLIISPIFTMIASFPFD